MQSYQECWAGSVDPTYLGRVDGGCQLNCSGNPAFKCGGDFEFSLYQLPILGRWRLVAVGGGARAGGGAEMHFLLFAKGGIQDQCQGILGFRF